MSTQTASPRGDVRPSIDARLDVIERALLGAIPRQERLAVVAQIETKLRESVEHDRPDEVVDALAASVRPTAGRSSSSRRRLRRERRPRSRLALSSGVLGIVALSLLLALPIVYCVAALSGDEWITLALVGGHLAAVTMGGFLAVVLGIAALVMLNRRQGRLVGHGWAIAGLCTGPLPILAGALTALVVAAQVPSMTITSAYTVSNVPQPGSPVLSPLPSPVCQGPPCATANDVSLAASPAPSPVYYQASQPVPTGYAAIPASMPPPEPMTPYSEPPGPTATTSSPRVIEVNATQAASLPQPSGAAAEAPAPEPSAEQTVLPNSPLPPISDP